MTTIGVAYAKSVADNSVLKRKCVGILAPIAHVNGEGWTRLSAESQVSRKSVGEEIYPQTREIGLLFGLRGPK